jgi:hypothetical protein
VSGRIEANAGNEIIGLNLLRGQPCRSSKIRPLPSNVQVPERSSLSIGSGIEPNPPCVFLVVKSGGSFARILIAIISVHSVGNNSGARPAGAYHGIRFLFSGRSKPFGSPLRSLCYLLSKINPRFHL